MNDVQVALTADLIIDRFYYLKLEEIKLCFRNAMASGKIYDRLDGNIILGWLNEYDAQRDEIVSSLSINEAHEQNNNSTGMFYGEYIKHLTERSENGDEEAKELLESHQFWSPAKENGSARDDKTQQQRLQILPGLQAQRRDAEDLQDTTLSPAVRW